ncbi:hypothetical protein R1sor_020665 [Riccia sorocarpa]|uniref:Uncharacterized protein n=1 Tax=Riccia sorocarpa TaxID=122646 RepID=A0ABD3GJ23_9MARC
MAAVYNLCAWKVVLMAIVALAIVPYSKVLAETGSSVDFESPPAPLEYYRFLAELPTDSEDPAPSPAADGPSRSDSPDSSSITSTYALLTSAAPVSLCYIRGVTLLASLLVTLALLLRL